MKLSGLNGGSTVYVFTSIHEVSKVAVSKQICLSENCVSISYWFLINFHKETSHKLAYLYHAQQAGREKGCHIAILAGLFEKCALPRHELDLRGTMCPKVDVKVVRNTQNFVNKP